MNLQNEEDDLSLSHSVAASCLIKIDENLPSKPLVQNDEMVPAEVQYASDSSKI